MTREHRLRPVGPDDREFLAALFAAGRAAMFAPLGLPEDEVAPLLAMQWRAQRLGHAATHPDADDFVIEVDDEPIGRVLVESGSTRVHLVDIALLPTWTGHGIGGAVIRDLVDDAGSRGRTVHLDVARDNQRAVALYRRIGFVDDDARATSPTHLSLRHP